MTTPTPLSSITPPPELFKQWEDDILNERDNVDHVLNCAWEDGYRAGADQELEACVKWLDTYVPRYCEWSANFFAFRRPKPPSLKEQALSELNLTADPDGAELSRTQVELIRHALEQLND